MIEKNKLCLIQVFEKFGKPVSKAKDGHFFSAEDIVTNMFWVISGEARLLRHSLNGKSVCLQITGNDLLAESSLYTEKYHCDGVAFTHCDGFQMSKKRFAAILRDHPIILSAHAAYLAEHLRELRTILEIRSYKKVSERLDAWITIHGADAIKTKQANLLAQQIGVTPAAFYRELSKRRNPE